MQYSFMLRMYGHIYKSMLKDTPIDGDEKSSILSEYKHILTRAKDIGQKNNLLGSYTLAAFFIAMNRCDRFTPEKNQQFLERGMEKSRLLKLSLGNAQQYLDPKRIAARKEWSRLTHQHQYENDWVVDILDKTDEYEMGYDYTECGVCKLCRDEGCPELAKYLCQLDFMLIELVGLRLTRTTTLAEGGDKCDFRFHYKD